MFVANVSAGILKVDQQLLVVAGVDVGFIGDAVDLGPVAGGEDETLGKRFVDPAQEFRNLGLADVEPFTHLDRCCFVIQPKSK
jgi:hypothetical protein